MAGIYSSTLYGSLSLISLLDSESIRSSINHECILAWIDATFDWSLDKQIELSHTHKQISAALAAYNERETLSDLFQKFFALFDSNHVILNDYCTHIAIQAKNCNLLNYL